MRLNEYSQIITLLTVAIELVLVLAVYSMDTNAAFKLPWIILITVAPIVGICVFFLFGRSGATKKVRARYRKIDQQLFAYLDQDEQIIEELSKKDERLANDFKYLWKCASSPVYKNTDVKYYGDTCDAMAAQLEDMMQAKKFIFLEYHAIEMAESFQALRKVLMAKAREGVEIRILYDDAGCIGFLNPRFIKYMESMGIQCRVFNPIMPVLNIFMNNRDHRKITVIDGKVAYTIAEGTQTGTTFRLRGKGVKYINRDAHGDQYVTVNVEVPKKLTKKQKDLLKDFDASLDEKNHQKRTSFFKKLKEKLDS